MDAEKRKRLEKAGWFVGDAATFLNHSPDVAALVEMRVALNQSLKVRQSAPTRC